MAHRQGNRDWSSGRPPKPRPAVPSEFEIEVKALGLAPETWLDSVELRRWCHHNRNRRYIPESLLKRWKMDVDLDM